MTVKVGIPRCLLYYYYGDIWKDFLERLGAEVLISSETSTETIDHGMIIDEVCLPLKVAIGHVCELKDKVDYLFLPRIISMAKGQYTCPNIMSMTDLIKNCVSNLPPLLVADINMRNTRWGLFPAVVSIGRTLGKNPAFSAYSWYKANHSSNMAAENSCPKVTAKPRILLLGHPYILNDKMIGMNFKVRLENLGFEVVTQQDVDDFSVEQANRRLKKMIFWQYCSNLAGAGLSFIYSLQPIAGVIFVTAFSCGPDSLIAETVKSHAISQDIPFMLQAVDEHTAEIGIITRLEAFGEMLLRRNER